LSQTYVDTDTHAGNDEDTIKVAPKKEGKDKNGTIKLKKPPPKHKLPGNWRDGSVIDGNRCRILPYRLCADTNR
jgi:SAGA-associated factor 73